MTAPAADSRLDVELATYRRRLSEWLAHEGQYLVIQGEDVRGPFATFQAALNAGYGAFGLTPFLVKPIHAVEPVLHFSRPIGSPVDPDPLPSPLPALQPNSFPGECANVAHDTIPITRPWTTQGKTYHVRKLSPLAISELIATVQRMIPDPRAGLVERIKSLPPDVARHVYDAESATMPTWPPDMGSAEFMRAVMTYECLELILYHAIRKSLPGFTRDHAREVAEDCSMEEYVELLPMVLPGGSDDGGTANPPAEGPARSTAATTSDTGPHSA